MASRFAQPSSRSSLFASYDAQTKSRTQSQSPGLKSSTNGYALNSTPPTGAAFAAYPSSNTGTGLGIQGYRAATPNKKGQYSDAVLSELESQNEDQLAGMSAKLTSAIGDEIRDSTAFAEKMNLNFENTRLKLKGTMNRMLRMAEKTGVGWRVWLGFFAAVMFLFWYVWLF